MKRGAIIYASLAMLGLFMVILGMQWYALTGIKGGYYKCIAIGFPMIILSVEYAFKQMSSGTTWVSVLVEFIFEAFFILSLGNLYDEFYGDPLKFTFVEALTAIAVAVLAVWRIYQYRKHWMENATK